MTKRKTQTEEVLEDIQKKVVVDEVVDEVVEEVVEEITEPVVEEITEPVVEELPPHVGVKPIVVNPKKKSLGIKVGTVANCKMLRLREGANIKTRVLAVMLVDTKVEVNLDNSTKSFYEVTFNSDTHSLIGYCVKEFINLG